MPTGVKMIYWQEGEFWIGYTEEFPDYETQGLSLEELKENLKDIYLDLSSGAIPCARREDELILA
jgi:predicted RNase H-like HicB family nuclease